MGSSGGGLGAWKPRGDPRDADRISGSKIKEIKGKMTPGTSWPTLRRHVRRKVTPVILMGLALAAVVCVLRSNQEDGGYHDNQMLAEENEFAPACKWNLSIRPLIIVP